ncbi:diaminopropionate ammonia-lyase [Cupriavidus sp. UYPR2.512]|uniref:diaminopropionate ammonia-lyase n=1 Tax=Cupriavidus sp. UYPR2.512 TaxID=1080187 RepID=UPI00037F2773|nr:diaminopropionate ammonia-lyase [Cupriavidus sp. UYPR2.512]UIF87886.1 diaminopropionate ammonia-lyase [Cupriavidus necator]
MIIANEKAAFNPYPAELQAIMNVATADESLAWLSCWNQLSDRPTPLYSLPDMAARLDVGSISVKDESVRSPLGSFKALGAPIALIRLILRRWPDESIDPRDLVAGKYADLVKGFTVVSATDGNHGRALAAAAQSIGCACTIVLHANVSQEREAAIAAYGARIVRIVGNYDESVEEAARLASTHGWSVVADTSYDGYEDIPRDVMQGYGAIAAEAIAQTRANSSGECPYTHVFLQGGVGGLAAGVVSYIWEIYGARRPKFIVVEPEQADCLFQSAKHGRPAKATGSVDSVMAGLACGETSPLAWRFLQESVDLFMTISDDDAVTAMHMLARGSERDVPIVSGESGAAGLAGLAVLREHKGLLAEIGVDSNSRVLLISTEGATAPKAFQQLVGVAPESIVVRQAEWLAR